jgi:hypothetical protein
METVNTNVLASPHGTYFYLMALVGILPSIMLGIIYLIVGTAFAHFAFKLAGGAGGKMKTLAIVGYSMLPIILVRVLAIVVVLAMAPGYPTIVNFYNTNAIATIAPDIVNFAYTSDVWWIVDVMTTGSFVWTGFLLIFGIREAHDTSTLWAVVVAILCMIVLGWTFWQAH